MRVAFQARADQLLVSAGQALRCDPFSTNVIAVTVSALRLGPRPTVTRTVGHGRGHEGQVVGLAMHTSPSSFRVAACQSLPRSPWRTP